jgi:hypothetical protein
MIVIDSQIVFNIEKLLIQFVNQSESSTSTNVSVYIYIIYVSKNSTFYEWNIGMGSLFVPTTY